MRNMLWPVLLAWMLLAPTPTMSADLGGDCCADLEDRISELEATAVKGGTRKVKLTISGEVRQAILDITGDATIDDIAASIALDGKGAISKDWSVGFHVDFDLGDGVTQSYVSIGGPLGTGSIGLLPAASDGSADVAIANTEVASKLLDGVYDGGDVTGVRYDSPSIGPMSFSLSWADSTIWGDDEIAAAMRIALDAGEIRIAAGAAYIFNDAYQSGLISGGLKHMTSGLFAQGAVNWIKGVDDLAWHVQAGIERNVLGIGDTTIYGEYRDDVTRYWGVGLVQRLDGAATDLYVNYRSDIDLDADSLTAGVRLKF